jgi:Zn-dependent protease
MSWTFPVGRLFGIPIRVHWLLAILVAGRILESWSKSGTWGLEWMSITMGILLVSILFHELAHCWVGISLGGHAEKILLWPLGGLAYVGHSGPPRDQIKISGVGPLSSFVLGGIALGILMGTGVRWEWSYLNPWAEWWPWAFTHPQGFLLHAVKLNFILALFNLLVPAYPLDGGQMLYSFLTIRHGPTRAAEIAATMAIPIAIAIGVWGMAQQDFNLLLIAVWILVEAFQLRRLAKIGELEAHPAFGQAGREFDYMPDKPKRKGWFARWRERRAQRERARELEKQGELRGRVDSVLEKVSREGIGSLTPDEKRILDEASKRSRGEN